MFRLVFCCWRPVEILVSGHRVFMEAAFGFQERYKFALTTTQETVQELRLAPLEILPSEYLIYRAIRCWCLKQTPSISTFLFASVVTKATRRSQFGLSSAATPAKMIRAPFTNTRTTWIWRHWRVSHALLIDPWSWVSACIRAHAQFLCSSHCAGVFVL